MEKYDQIKQDLTKVIEAKKKIAFVEGYDATDEETLGLLVSQHLKWSGNRIVECLLNALEDANFHSLREELENLESIKELLN